MKITSVFKLSVALTALSSFANAVTIFDVATAPTTYPTIAAANFNDTALDVYGTTDTGNGNGWGSGVTGNFNGASSAINPGDQKTQGANTTTYFGPTFYAGYNRDQSQAQVGVIYKNGNGYRIRMNDVSQTVHNTNGGDVNIKAVFMFDTTAGDYVFGSSDTLVATVATPNIMNVRSTFASYRAMVKADGQYYAGSLNTIDVASLTGANSSTHTMTENAASATWTLMDNMESGNNFLQGVAGHPNNLTVDGTTSVIGSTLTSITQVGFLLETSAPVQTGGYNFGVRDFSAEATAVPEPSSYALIAGMLALASIMVRRRK